MKLLQHSSGMVIAFGFDMENRCADHHVICWSDFDGKTWEPAATNCAGSWRSRFAVAPQFVRECEGVVIAYQPGICLEMTFLGSPLVWGFNPLQADAPQLLQAA